MLRSKHFACVFGLSVVMVSLLFALNVPASEGVASADKAALQPPGGVSASGQADCVQAPQASDAPIFALSEGGACKTDPGQVTLPDWMRAGGRTCRCSCGFPCKTDADCGGGVGSCRGGISCC